MMPMLPIALGVALLAIAGAIFLSGLTPANRKAGQRRPVNRELTAWAAEVGRRLPGSFDALQIAKAGKETNGRKPRPSIKGPGVAMEHGWRWVADLPGAVVADDIDPGRLAGAINRGDRIAAVAEVSPAGDGWADIRIWRTDPIATTRPVPWRPGAQPPCVRPGTVCLGPQRDGKHMHMQVVDGSVGAIAALFAGRRGSGKSETMRLALAQAIGWGFVRPVVIDTVRQGVDFAGFGLPIITDHREAVQAFKDMRAECLERAKALRASGQQKIVSFTPDRPLILPVVDEVHDLLADKKAKAEVASFVKETRATGASLWVATQYPTADVIDAGLRMQLANRWCGRVSNVDEARVILGESLGEGRSPHLLRHGPGSCVVDFDGAGMVTGRTWQMTPGWLAAHVRALAAVGV